MHNVSFDECLFGFLYGIFIIKNFDNLPEIINQYVANNCPFGPQRAVFRHFWSKLPFFSKKETKANIEKDPFECYTM